MTKEELNKIKDALKDSTKFTTEEINEIISSLKQFSSALEDTTGKLNTVSEQFNQQLTKILEEFKKNKDGSLDLRSAVSTLKKQFEEASDVEKNNIKERERILNELKRVEDSSAYAKLSGEQKNAITQRISLLKSEINLQTQKENLEKKKYQNLQKNIEVEEKALKQKIELYDKNAAIERVNTEAKLKREKIESRGFNKSGKKNSAHEIVSKYAAFVEGIKKDSVGRNIGKGLSSVANGAAGAMNFVNSGKMDVGAIGNKVSGALSNLGPYGAAAGGLVSIFTTLFEMYSKVDTAASKYSRTVGGSSITMRKMKAEAARMATEFNKLRKRSYDVAEMIDTMAEYSVGLGRSLEYVSDASLKAMKDLKDYGIGMDVVNMFDTLGYSVEMISDKIGAIAGRAAGAGLNAKAVTDAMTKNLKLAQKYTFSQGMKSLEKMAQDSVSLKFNMQAAANFAEKVNTLEGAASVGAQLSVLGGNYAAFGNPLELLFGGLQGVDSLHEKMMQMTKDLAYFDEEKGMLDMSALDKQLLRQASQTMGVSYDDMANMAFNQYKDRKVDKELSKYDNITPEMKEYLRNIGQLNEKGEMEYKIGADKNGKGGKKINLKDLTKADLEALRKESNAKTNTQEQNVGEILGETRGIQEKLDDLINTIKQKIVGFLMKLVGEDGYSEDDHTRGKGWTQDELYNYNQIKRALDDATDGNRQESVDALDEEQKKILREAKIIDENNKLIGGFATSAQKWYSTAYHVGNVFKSRRENEENKDEEENNVSYFNDENASAFRAEGGLIVGPGTETSDSINTHLSNGEYVVKAKNVRGNLGLLNDINNGRINTGSNPYGFTDISKSTQTSNTLSGGNSNMSFEPLNININGSLDISANGYSQSINGKDILSQEMINKIIREIQTQTDYSFDRDKVHWKYQMV
jgi:hypothetical protein